MDPQIKRVAFTLSPEKPLAAEVFSSGGSYYLLELASSSEPDMSEFAAKLEELKEQEMQRAGGRLVSSLIERLRAESTIWVNPEIFKTGA